MNFNAFGALTFILHNPSLKFFPNDATDDLINHPHLKFSQQRCWWVAPRSLL